MSGPQLPFHSLTHFHLHPLAAVPSHWLAFPSLLPSKCAFAVLISPTRCTSAGCVGKNNSKGRVVHAEGRTTDFFLIADKQQWFNYDPTAQKKKNTSQFVPHINFDRNAGGK